ncbi:redoxin domain-containing protein [Niabella insulamsoli]|uniref:TlpA disulfide reductase family protein n=1 Tax=Niabella insulamsoli TaxID=3144874 RepID=UPI0031FC1781
MKQLIILSVALFSLAACNQEQKHSFKISGKIANTSGRQIYLEEVPIGTMRPVIVDSAALDKDGRFEIETETGEATIYNLRIDQNTYPVASLINDKPSVEIEVVMNAENNQLPEKYEVKGSPASQKMKDFLFAFNDKLQNIFEGVSKIDSLSAKGTPDSTIAPLLQASKADMDAAKNYVLDEMKKSDNPALTIYMLGFYQSSTGNPALGLEPLSNEQVNGIIADVIQKNPGHTGMVALQKELQSQQNSTAQGGWVGKPAPDFTLPDVNGNPVALSSFKGKYVLLDFWASWCKPCRIENPNIVEAYNKFKNKNFTVVGVSLDQAKNAWLKAIKDDELTWPHLSDLRFWESPVVALYGFEGIPFNVLIDPQGKIIAEGLRGRFLESKLEEVLN